MARETKAQRLARESAELAHQMKQEEMKYPDRLMRTLERAQHANFELEVREGVFVLFDRDNHPAEQFFVYPTYSKENQLDLVDLEFRVTAKEQENAEEEERFKAKIAALAKLTAFERDLLGL